MKLPAAVLVGLLLLWAGERGRRHARLEARLGELSAFCAELSRGVEPGQTEAGRPAAAPRATILDPGPSQLSSQQVQTLIDAAELRLGQFRADYPTAKLTPAEDLAVRMAKATLANAQQRFAEVLEIITPADEERSSPRVHSASPNLAGVLRLRADAFYGMQHWRDALAEYRRLLALQPDRLSTIAHVAYCEFALGQLTESIKSYAALAQTYDQLGTSLLGRGRTDSARAQFDAAINLQTWMAGQPGGSAAGPKLALSYHHLGDALLAEAKPDTAAQEYGKAIEIQNLQFARDGRGGFAIELAGSYHSRANALLTQRKLPDAVQDYQKAIELLTSAQGKEATDLTSGLASTEANLADALLAQGKAESALVHYDKAVDARKKLPEPARADLAVTYNNRGVARRAVGKADAAVQDYEAAIRIEGDASNRGAENMATLGPTDRAVDECQVKFLVFMTFADKTIDVITRARPCGLGAKNEPAVGLAIALRNRGHTLLQQGRLDSALADFNRALEIYSRLVEQEGESDLTAQFAKTLDSVAWIYAANPDSSVRDGAKARQYALKACDLTGWRLAPSLEALAAACAEAGSFSDAVRWQQRAVQLVPAALKTELGARLRLYQSGTPYRAPPSATD